MGEGQVKALMIKIVTERAWDMSRRTGIDVDDLINEGHLLAMQAIECFDPKRGMQVSSWIYRWVQLGLLRFAEKNRNKPPADEFMPDLLPSPRVEWRPDVVLDWKLLLASLSDDANLVCRILLYAPEDVLGKPRRTTAREVRARLRQYFLGKARWTHKRWWTACNELKEVFG